jgi:predicted ATPase/class 3 adenylate cyclase
VSFLVLRTGSRVGFDRVYELKGHKSLFQRRGAIAFPSGTVTFLFTDIEGSTKLAQQYPNAMPVLLARHHQILHQSIEAQNGHVFQIVGDSFAAAFHSAANALHAALEAQRLLHKEVWSPALIKVRMGIHTGAAQLNENKQYSGYAVLAFTQRIMSAGHGGQVLLSSATRELVRDTLPMQTELLDLGEKRLKDILRPEHLYQLKATGLPVNFPPLKTLDSFPNNLPLQLTTFIGREKEIAEIKEQLDSHRLVTLTGAGGTGKTRLSLQVAAALLEKFEDGVWFVELAPLTDPELIPQTILSAIGITEQAGQPPFALLRDYLHEKKSLLLLDNCEHLIEASAKVTNTLLDAAPSLKILASSREALGVKGELSYPVPSLSLPDIQHLPMPEQLSQYEAVRLFIDRASLVSPHFDVDRNNAPFIAQICYRLDGIALAIELAAARVKMLSVEQISKRLDDRFHLLTGGARTALPRQQTLRALIDWSYDLLSENERLLLRRLAVFAATWTLEAAEEVCSDDGIERDTILDLLSQLVNKSLVVVNENSESRVTRYRMLETIRQYAREKLLESGENNTIHERQLDYYLGLVRKAELEFFGPKELVWLVWLENELDNLRATVEWSIKKYPDVGLELINRLGYFLLEHFYISDMDNWLSQLMPHSVSSIRIDQRAQGLLHWAWCTAARHEDMARARQLVEESLSIYEEIGESNGLAHGFHELGFTYLWEADYERGFPLLKRALELFRETKDIYWMAHSLQTMATYLKWYEHETGLSYLKESLSLYRDLGSISGMIEALKQLGAIELRLGNFEFAHKWLDEGFSILQGQASSWHNSKTMSYDLGDLAFYEGDYELAQQYYEDCLLWSKEKGLPTAISQAKVQLGYLYLRRGEGQNALPFLREALQFFQERRFTASIVFTVEGLAELAVLQGKYEKAARLFAWTEAVREKLDDPRSPVEQASLAGDLAVIHSKVSNSDFARHWIAGQAMNVEEATALALTN